MSKKCNVGDLLVGLSSITTRAISSLYEEVRDGNPGAMIVAWYILFSLFVALPASVFLYVEPNPPPVYMFPVVVFLIALFGGALLGVVVGLSVLIVHGMIRLFRSACYEGHRIRNQHTAARMTSRDREGL